MTLQEIGRYSLSCSGMSLVVAQGSVVEFRGDAIVNAANTGCLGGGGVDAAIARMGGRNLALDRQQLKVIGIDEDGRAVRCREGDAVLTGPNYYGSLPTHIIHAVGPDFRRPGHLNTKRDLLQSAYTKSLDIVLSRQLERVAFALLSAGVFRGQLSLQELLHLSVVAIEEWAKILKHDKHEKPQELHEIYLCGFTPAECETLKEVCDHVLPAIS